MGHIQVRGGAKPYQGRFRDDQGNWRAKRFEKRGDAQRWIRESEHAKDHGEYVDVSNKITVAECAERWLETALHRDSTATRAKSTVRVHIADSKLGKMRLTAVRKSHCQSWVTERSSTLSAGTVRLMAATLSAVFNYAVEDRMIARNPAKGLTLPKLGKAPIEALGDEMVTGLADEVPERCYAMIIAQAGLGPRIAELLALRVQDVDFLRRTVKIESQLSQDGKTRLFELKTDNSYRTIPLPQVVQDVLAAHIAKFPPLPDGSIFSTERGNWWRQEHYQARVFTPAAQRAGLPDGTTPHDLRHYYASTLLHAGESVVTVANRLGDTPKEVMKTYGHLIPNSEDRTRLAIDAALTGGQSEDKASATSLRSQ